MKNTTAFERLAAEVPQSETQWRDVAARAHRLRGVPGDLAAAATHELHIAEVRAGNCAGSSRAIRYCPRCAIRGVRVVLLWMGGMDRCGNCSWPQQ